MSSRIDLQSKLEELLCSRNVYYNPPESLSMQYPAIRYNKNKIDKKAADDTAYLLTDGYKLTVIDPRPDNPVIKKLLELPMCSYDTGYKANNLNHDVLTLYW